MVDVCGDLVVVIGAVAVVVLVMLVVLVVTGTDVGILVGGKTVGFNDGIVVGAAVGLKNVIFEIPCTILGQSIPLLGSQNT